MVARSCGGGAACARSRGGCGVDAIAGPRAATGSRGGSAGKLGAERRGKLDGGSD